jgi:hypothetical protein
VGPESVEAERAFGPFHPEFRHGDAISSCRGGGSTRKDEPDADERDG